MQDTLLCPICNNKLENSYQNRYTNISKTDLIRRRCAGPGHYLHFYTSKENRKITIISFSLDFEYSKYIEINFIKEKTKIDCRKNNTPYTIILNKILEIDFPILDKLKEKVNTYILIS